MTFSFGSLLSGSFKKQDRVEAKLQSVQIGLAAHTIPVPDNVKTNTTRGDQLIKALDYRWCCPKCSFT